MTDWNKNAPAITGQDARPPIQVLAMMEAASVTGPAKNLIGFGQWLNTPEGLRTGVRMSFATFDRNARADKADSFIGTARAAGIDTHVIQEKRRFSVDVIPQLRRIVAATNPDIIQTHNGKSHLLIKLLPGLRVRRQWFAFQHGYTSIDLKLRLYNQVDRLTLRSADRVVSVCQAFAPKLIEFGVKSARIRALHNAAVPIASISEPDRSALLDQLGIRRGERVILSIGRLSREKGHADLVRAAGNLGSILGEWKLVLVGAGPEQSALERLATSVGIRDRVVFAGHTASVARFYSIADVFVLPSHSEGSSNVLLEAMMARVPIVATSAGGNGEIVLGGHSGLLVPIGDSLAIANAIARLLQDPSLARQCVDSAYARAGSDFSVERYRARLLSFYDEALAEPASSTRTSSASWGSG
ncbi:MAG TPA: glycosyltransferase [Steroidobacteraceae bacterium]|nr:glycosyltransferase [Steroidobacteraceae bacterium]